MKVKVTVIIPIYKVEHFIERCACALFEQTLQEVEFIFVDDCTTDKSMEILNKVIERNPERKEMIKIISHKENKGLPTARNTGLEHASGEYIFHCDSDDFVELNMLEVLYNKAKETDADWVWCDWFLSFEQNERYMKQPQYETAENALYGMLVGNMKYNVWNKLVKRSLYEDNNIKFPSGHGMGEDMTMIRLAACAKKATYISQAFYHYVRTNTNAYTQNVNEKQLADIKYNVNETLEFLKLNYHKNLDQEIAYFKLNIKLPFLIGNDKKQYQLWKEWYPEANKYILSNKNIASRTRILQ